MSYWGFKNLQVWLVKSKLGITDQNQMILIELEHFWLTYQNHEPSEYMGCVCNKKIKITRSFIQDQT